MTDSASTSTTNDPSHSPAKKSSGVHLVVRLVLFVVLGLALVALGYDRLIARPRNEAEFKKIQALVDVKNSNPASKPITNKDVRETMGRDPSKTEENENYALEFYTWRRGLPTDNYYICVVYTPKDKMLLHEVKLNELPDPNTLPGSRTLPADMASGGQPAGAPLGMSMSSGEAGETGAAGAGPAAGPPPGPPAGGPPLPARPEAEAPSESSGAEKAAAPAENGQAAP